MKETGFSDIGRIEAIRLLFEESPFKNERIKTEITDGFAVTSSKMLLEPRLFPSQAPRIQKRYLGNRRYLCLDGDS